MAKRMVKRMVKRMTKRMAKRMATWNLFVKVITSKYIFRRSVRG